MPKSTRLPFPRGGYRHHLLPSSLVPIRLHKLSCQQRCRNEPTSPPMQLYQQIAQRSLNFQHGDFGRASFGSPVQSPMMPRTNTTRTGKPLPFASSNIVSAKSTPVPPPASTPKSPDTFGAPVQSAGSQRKKLDLWNRSSSLSPISTRIYGDETKATVSDESESSATPGRRVSSVSPPTPDEKTNDAGAATSSPTKRKRGRPRKHPIVPTEDQTVDIGAAAGGVKRKMNNIMTQKEIEADIRKRPKNYGMSPFHQELLKMNLTALADW